jgi:hypothetical protein
MGYNPDGNFVKEHLEQLQNGNVAFASWEDSDSPAEHLYSGILIPEKKQLLPHLLLLRIYNRVSLFKRTSQIYI